MFLSRLARSFKDHDWFTAAVELLLLVTGIFAGFQLDRWNDGRLDQLRAGEYREQLITDLSIERSDVEWQIAYHEQVRDFALHGLTAWSDTPSAGGQELVVALYQASNILPSTEVRGAFEALSNNGLLDLVGGPALASKLSTYYGQAMNAVFNEVKRYRMELRGVMPIPVQIQIVNNCTMVALKERIIEDLSGDCDLGLEPAEADRIITDIVAHPNMRSYLQQGIARDSTSITLLRSKLEFIEDLIAALRASERDY